MEVAAYVLFLVAGIVAIIARILSSDGHSDLSRWVYCVSINLTIIGGFAWYQDKVWKRAEKNAATEHVSTVAIDKGVLDAATPSRDPNARPPYENPTPEYIEALLSETSWESRDFVKSQFIGIPVSWDGRIFSRTKLGDGASLLLSSGLGDLAASQCSFWVPVMLPDNKFLLLLPRGAPLHVDGIIGSFAHTIPELKDVTATLLSDS